MGAGGVSPEYFMDRMSWAEAESFMDGFESKRKENWEMVRRVVHATFQSQSTKILELEDVLHFPWDDEDDRSQDDDEKDIEALRQKAMQMKELLKKKENGIC